MKLKKIRDNYIEGIKNTAEKVWNSLRKYALPISFAAVFYSIMYLFGNRTICVSKATFGVPCPGCGMTRSFKSLIKGDIHSAFYYHPLFILVILAAFVILFRNTGSISKIYKSAVTWISLLIVFISVWVVRMIQMFPDKPPIDYNIYGLFPVIYRFIRNII
ncbi:MAG: DUF2752 domain-containing protein [Clostridia bacterium]|nr:DUF2752 domain-containing protein [Clostridia bacterium]